MYIKNISIYLYQGKTQENLRNRVRVDVVTNREKALKLVAQPSFKRSNIIREDLVIIQRAVQNVLLDRPIYVGFAVLDLSKLLMAQFHYDSMKTWFTDINLCFTDTGTNPFTFLHRSMKIILI